MKIGMETCGILFIWTITSRYWIGNIKFIGDCSLGPCTSCSTLLCKGYTCHSLCFLKVTNYLEEADCLGSWNSFSWYSRYSYQLVKSFVWIISNVEGNKIASAKEQTSVALGME